VKRREFITLLVGAVVIGVLVNPSNPNAASDSGMALAAAASLPLKLHVIHAVAERDFDAAFDDLRRAQATAVLVFPDSLFIDARGPLAELAARHKLPVLYCEEEGDDGKRPLAAFHGSTHSRSKKHDEFGTAEQHDELVAFHSITSSRA
jgi:hypothetical protein